MKVLEQSAGINLSNEQTAPSGRVDGNTMVELETILRYF